MGVEHPYREPCRAIVSQASGGELRGEASADLVQEFAHRRFIRTRDRATAVGDARRVAALCVLHDLRPADIPLALELYERSTRLSARDAMFAAVALNRGIDAMLTPDRDFDDVPGLERIDPADSAAVAGLAFL